MTPASAAARKSPDTDGTSGTAAIFAELLADLLSIESVPVDGNFFDDLGADSMVMARFCARVRKRADLPAVSMKDVYGHPTVENLAAALAGSQDTRVEPTPPPEMAKRASTAQYVLCGALQLVAVVGYLCVAAPVIADGVAWISAGSGFIEVYLRSAAVGAVAFLVTCVVPIVAKWTLIGRWKRQQIDLWSLTYVRFWIVKTLIRTSPLALFPGSPLYVFYLRALGANIGRGVVIFSRHLPVCTDLLTIGDGTVIRKDTFFNCYRAHAGTIQTGSVTIGTNVTVGEAAVLDIETSLGDGSQLGHVSSLQAGQALPAGERRHGYAAQERTDVDYRGVEPARCGRLRRAAYAAMQLAVTGFQAHLVLEPRDIYPVALTEFTGLGIERRRVAVCIGKRFRQRALGQPCRLVEHLPNGLAVEVTELPGGHRLLQLQHLEQVELQIARCFCGDPPPAPFLRTHGGTVADRGTGLGGPRLVLGEAGARSEVSGYARNTVHRRHWAAGHHRRRTVVAVLVQRFGAGGGSPDDRGSAQTDQQ